MYKRKPAVFVVGDTYQIMTLCEEQTLMWVKIGEKCYYDHSNGVLRSDTKIHRITVPQQALDQAGAYTLCERLVIERKPYFSETGDVEETVYDFRPVRGDVIKAFHLADVHGKTNLAISAAKAFGDIDFLILNGDILDHSGCLENFNIIYDLAQELTGGNIPILFSRGNHDLRGVCAEKLAEYTPADNGKSYYTFRLGGIWGILLDCGEDKVDEHEEYGHTICCHSYRRTQTEYLKQVIQNRAAEYEEEGVQYRLVLSHIPFAQQMSNFIEQELYREWCSLLKTEIKPDVMLCGHMHRWAVNAPGWEKDVHGQPCTVVVGSALQRNDNPEKDYLIGTGVTFRQGDIEVSMIDSKGEIVYHTKLQC